MIDRLDVQTIPSDIGFYLAGFADGEGSSNVSFRPRSDYRLPWKVSLCFNISQKEREILTEFQEWLKCGSMRSRPDGVWYYEVNTLDAIVNCVIPFFERFCFKSRKKKRDFAKFIQLAELIKAGAHLNEKGVRQILNIRREMNDGGKRRYHDQDILSRYSSSESSETKRQTPQKMEMI